MDDDVKRTHSLQYKYTFLHPLSSTEVTQIAGSVANSDFDCSNPPYTVIAWKTGAIRLNGPVTLGLQYVKEGEFLEQLIFSE